MAQKVLLTTPIPDARCQLLVVCRHDLCRFVCAVRVATMVFRVTVSALCVLLALVASCDGLRMQMDPASRKCFGEDLNKDVLAVSSFTVVNAQSGSAPGLLVTVRRSACGRGTLCIDVTCAPR